MAIFVEQFSSLSQHLLIHLFSQMITLQVHETLRVNGILYNAGADPENLNSGPMYNIRPNLGVPIFL